MLNDYYHGTHNYHHPNDGLEWSTYSVIFFYVLLDGIQTGAIWRILICVRGHQADCSLFVWIFIMCVCVCCISGGKQEPTGGLFLPGRGSEEGSKVTKSISCELLRASSVVTHRGSRARKDTLPLSLFSFSLPSFPVLSFPLLPSREHTPLLMHAHILYAKYNTHTYHHTISTHVLAR